MNVINAHLVGYSKAAKGHVIPLHGIVSTRSYQRISLQKILFVIKERNELYIF